MKQMPDVMDAYEIKEEQAWCPETPREIVPLDLTRADGKGIY